MACANLAFFLSPQGRNAWPYQPKQPVSLPEDFFGVCVATSEDPACDDYILARLRELGVKCVRLDYGYDSPGGFADRLVGRLSSEGYRVALHLVAPRRDMEALDTPDGIQPKQRASSTASLY